MVPIGLSENLFFGDGLALATVHKYAVKDADSSGLLTVENNFHTL